MNRNVVLFVCLAVVSCLALDTPQAAAVIQPSSDLLLPYFEVDTRGAGRTTLFAVCNHADEAVEILISIHTNWGIPVLEVPLKLEADQVRTVNLRDWLLAGDLPDRRLGAEEIAHLQAALSGRASARDQLYYSTEVEPGLAVGWITFRVRGTRRPEVLWGDFFLVDPAEDHLQAETLVPLGRSSVRPECVRHGVRFLAGSDFEAGTELVIWTSRRLEPSSSPEIPETSRLTADVEVYNEAGRVIGHDRLPLLPVQKISAEALELAEPFGWLDLVTDAEAVVTARYGMGGRSGVPVETFCLPAEARGPGLRIEQFVNGNGAPTPPGLLIPMGDPIHWEYAVTNTGTTPLDAVAVTNSLGIPVECPEGSLGPGKGMICTASGTAEPCAQEVTATATGTPPSEPPVLAQDTSYYTGDEEAAVDVELFVNGLDADEPPGPYLMQIPWYWSTMTAHWRLQATNTGKTPLSGVRMVSEREFFDDTCPETSLAPGESVECEGMGELAVGPSANTGTATASTLCGRTVSDRDPAYYVGESINLSLRLTSLINGQDAGVPPGPQLPVGSSFTWTFVVVNVGNISAECVSVHAAQAGPITCSLPYSGFLAPGETMICTATGYVAALGQQQVTASVHGRFDPRLGCSMGIGTTATDVSYFVGVSYLPHP